MFLLWLDIAAVHTESQVENQAARIENKCLYVLIKQASEWKQNKANEANEFFALYSVRRLQPCSIMEMLVDS